MLVSSAHHWLFKHVQTYRTMKALTNRILKPVIFVTLLDFALELNVFHQFLYRKPSKALLMSMVLSFKVQKCFLGV